MMTKCIQVKIVRKNGAVHINAPYCAARLRTLRTYGGNFDPTSKEWVFDDTPSTATMIAELFGNDSPSVVVRITSQHVEKVGNEWVLGGYKIAQRVQWHLPVQMAAGVSLERGRWCDSQGSLADPQVNGTADLSLLVVVRRDFALRRHLEIVETGTANGANPLSACSDDQLLAEVARRHLLSSGTHAKDNSAGSTWIPATPF